MKVVTQSTVVAAGEERGIRTAIVTATAGANTIVAAVPDRRIVLVGGKLVASTAGTIEFRTGTTPITGELDLALNEFVNLSPSMLATDEGELLGLQAETTVDGWIEFVLL